MHGPAEGGGPFRFRCGPWPPGLAWRLLFDPLLETGVKSHVCPASRVRAGRKGDGVASRKALITGITGQDGSYLAELLLEKGYEVHGLVRRSSSFNTWRIDHVRDRLSLHYGDLVDQNSLARALEIVAPDEVYNLAAQSHVKVSFEMPEYTTRRHRPRACCGCSTPSGRSGLETRVYQAGSSGDVRPGPGDARRPRRPPSTPALPTRCAKVFGHWMAVNYRESYGLHVSNGILFNHESPRRGENFVTRKITMGVAAHQAGPREGAASRKPRRQARLGLRPGLRRGDVADAPAGRAPTTTSSRPARPTPCASSARRPSPPSTSTGRTS